MPESRKLQQIGGNSLYVSLPKRWTNRMQLKKGNKVTLVPQSDGSLYIYPVGKQERPREIILEIAAKGSGQSLKREITAAYVDGFDVIKLKAEERITVEQQEFIREIIDHLFGLEVIALTGNTITIQCLLKRDLPIEKTIQRIHNVIQSMFSETIVALEVQNTDLAGGLARRMHDVRRLSLVSNRLLRSLVLFPTSAGQMKITLIDCVDYLQILHIISEIACNVKKISESVTVLSDQSIPEHVLELLHQACTKIKDMYENSIQALLSKDIPLANDVLDTMHEGKLILEKLWELCINADEKSEISSLALSHTYLLVDSLRQIQQYTVEIAEIAIDRTEADIIDDQNI